MSSIRFSPSLWNYTWLNIVPAIVEMSVTCIHNAVTPLSLAYSSPDQGDS